MKSEKKERTDDTNLEIITRATQKDFLFLRRCLFWRHPLFDGGKRRKGEGKASRGGRQASEQSRRSIPEWHFLKGKGEAAAPQVRTVDAHLSALVLMKPFSALIVILSFTTSVLSQQPVTTTNAYVSSFYLSSFAINPPSSAGVSIVQQVTTNAFGSTVTQVL